MTIGNYYNYNNPYYIRRPNFCSTENSGVDVINKPIEKVENAINNTVDTFTSTPETEEKKKSKKTAVYVGSSVLVLSAAVALLNPKFSSKLINKLKTISQKAETKGAKHKDSFMKGKFYKACENFANGTVKVLEFTNNANSAKDIYFKKLCCEEKFNGVKNDTTRKILTTIDKGFIKIMKKPHEKITEWFDNISKSTVKRSYNKANKNLNSLDDILVHYKNKLSLTEQQKLESKLEEISNARNHFSERQLKNRFESQEKLMENLESETIVKMKEYWQGVRGKNSGTYIKEHLNFWAQDILQPGRDKLEKQGLNAIDKLVGNGSAQKGLYNEALDILAPHLKNEEKSIINDYIKSIDKKLKKANHAECVEYFDKKRDLVLGGAPTDIITGLGMVGLSGIAIGSAKTKEEKMSRAATVGFPAIAGVGTSLAMTALLFSGVQGMIIGSLAGVGLSKLGSSVDKHFIPKPPSQPTELAEVPKKITA